MPSIINAATSGGLISTADTSGVLQLQTANTTAITIDASQNVNFSKVGQRITGDFSNATLANRVSFQTSTTNGNTTVNALPNGTAQISRFIAHNNSDPTNCAVASLDARSTEVALFSAINGTGTYVPLIMYTGGSERLRIDTSGNLLVGTTTRTSDKVTFASDGNALNQLGLVALNDAASQQGFINFRNSALTPIGSVARVGTTNAVIYNTTSDYRLKTVIGDVTGQGSRIDALKPIDYQWKEGNGQARGFLAHEFQTVYPNSVSGDKDALDKNGKPSYQSMQASSSEVMADLIAEIQSLRKRVAQLESK